MIKSELMQKIAEEFDEISEKDVSMMLNYLVTVISNAISSHKRIEIRGFGSFSLRHRQPRKARNPRTHKEVLAIAKYLPHFKPGKELKEKVNLSNSSIKD